MKRRTILKYTSLATGAAIGVPLLTVIVSGCQPDVADNYQPKFFSEKEIGQLQNLIDVILPKTDSPSASEVGVHKIIDSMVGEVYTPEQQVDFSKGFTALSEHLAKAGFQNKKAEEQMQLLQGLDNSKDESLAAVQDAYLDIKQQTIAYYLSNEEIGTKYLNYLPVPGEYMPCISMEEAGGKLWSI